MSTVLGERSAAAADSRSWRPWIAVLLGLAALYVPTYVDLAGGLWRDDAYAHGPIIVAVFAWLVWRSREALLDESARPAPLAGGLLAAFGLALYLLGRTQSLALFEVASHIPVIAGVVLALRGREGLRRLAFPVLFLLFLVPLPGFVLDTVTVPLKELVSQVVEVLLVALAYPVEREGVVLWVGDYQMLIADACSGLNSLYSLFALGLLYTHVTRPRRAGRTALVLLGIVPIAVLANIVRVMVLVLVTYHFGEAAAQGWLHDFAGMLVFVVALLLLLAYDAMIRRAIGSQSSPSPLGEGRDEGKQRTLTPTRSQGRGGLMLAAVAATAMIGTALAAPALKPVADPGPAPDLEQVIPATFGDWRVDPDVVQIAPTPDVQANLDRLYRQIVSRTYVNAQGERMMLTVAHGGDQSDALKAHRQEACYAAQGFEIRGLGHGTLATAGRSIPVTRMHALRGERSEPVTYWFTMGDRVVLGRAERLRVQLEHGLAGRIPDGMLVRISSLSEDPARAYASHASFVAALVAAVPSRDAARFLGAARD